MPKAPTVTPTIKEATLKYLKELYENTLNGIPLSKEEKEICRYQSSLAKHMCDILYDKNGNPLTTIPTIKKAIESLINEGLIEQEKDDILRYVPPIDEVLQRFPILNSAPLITVTPLPVDSVAFFRVPEIYSAAIAKYLNTVFHAGDIHTVNLGSLIMCIDIAPPVDAPIKKKKRTLETRVLKKLSLFNIEQETYYNHKTGYTEKELYEQQLNRAREQYEDETKKQSFYGGRAENSQFPEKKFKKKK